MSRVLKRLGGSSLRSMGRSEEVVKDVLKDPDLFSEFFKGMIPDDPVVRMRSADAIRRAWQS